MKNMMNEWVCPCIQLMDWEAAQARQMVQQLGEEGVLAEWDNFVLDSMDVQLSYLLNTLTTQQQFYRDEGPVVQVLTSVAAVLANISDRSP